MLEGWVLMGDGRWMGMGLMWEDGRIPSPGGVDRSIIYHGGSAVVKEKFGRKRECR